MFLCRYLKSCMWQEDKKKEMRERTLVQALYRDLLDMAKLNDLNKKVQLSRGNPFMEHFSINCPQTVTESEKHSHMKTVIFVFY